MRFWASVIAAICTIVTAWGSIALGKPLHVTGAILITMTSICLVLASANEGK